MIFDNQFDDSIQPLIIQEYTSRNIEYYHFSQATQESQSYPVGNSWQRLANNILYWEMYTDCK